MTIAKPLLISFSLLAFASAPAFANEEAKNRSAASGASTSSSQDKNQRGAKATGQVSVEQLTGKKVTDAQGQELGQINDVVIDLQGGRVHAAVLEFGGTLGLGEKNYAFPISQLKPGKSQGQYTLNVDKQKLKDAEGFAQGQWPAMNDEYWGKIGGQAKASAGSGKSQSQKMHLVRASELIGQNVQDKSGNDVGEIKDVMVNLNSGQLQNIVLDLNEGGRTTIQAKALKAGTEDKLVLNMDAQQLKQKAQKSGKSRNQGSAAGASGSSGEQQQQSGGRK